ncbi:hypothetical protein GOODEAATRI_012105 [Goodea atripinnis]|uniref:PH domain-containing protein n=1 Tax=Goodea atripinnis TaxID=208336 RepID=A0ABV0MH44_9TELE
MKSSHLNLDFSLFYRESSPVNYDMSTAKELLLLTGSQTEQQRWVSHLLKRIPRKNPTLSPPPVAPNNPNDSPPHSSPRVSPLPSPRTSPRLSHRRAIKIQSTRLQQSSEKSRVTPPLHENRVNIVEEAYTWSMFLCDSQIKDIVSCPALCKCSPRRMEVVCNEVPLTEYPTEGLAENTTMLTIQLTNITSISEHHLKATPFLQELHMYGNHLESLSSHLLRGVPQLHTLDLTGNKLSDLPVDAFSDAPLQNLVLKNNQIKRADAKWFPKNSSLTWLDLSGNHLTEISVGLFQRLPQLENLDLSNNRLEKISVNSLDPLTKLERLNLQDNKLETLNESVFQYTHNLTSLFLTRNKLTKLPQNLFQGLTRLIHLSLDNNQLSHIPKGLLDPLSSLEDDGLDLTVNPLLCDREVEYLWRWLQKKKKKVLLADNITCALPESLAGRSVISLTENDLNIGSQPF